jgi:FlaA1/EpsC-like NDP-sugar epimerase
LIVVDFNENGLTELTRELRSTNYLNYNIDFRTYPISLNDKVFDKLFVKESKFDIVANFAAHKHVRSEKDIFSIEALIKNNIGGAIKLLDLVNKFGVEHFFSVSTDKAANPVNIMGASKSLMEKIILSYKNNFKVSTARFANVAFSNGSLLDGFINRLNKRQPLSCPNDVKRFFVSPKESGQICLLASIIGDSGDIFFPKFNFKRDQIYFKDIAIEFLKFIGLDPEIMDSEKDAKNFKLDNRESKKYPIFFFKTNTSGEKLYEEFYTDDEHYSLLKHDALGVINNFQFEFDVQDLKNKLEFLFKKKEIDKIDIVNLIKVYLPDFDHIETGKNLDQKM